MAAGNRAAVKIFNHIGHAVHRSSREDLRALLFEENWSRPMNPLYNSVVNALLQPHNELRFPEEFSPGQVIMAGGIDLVVFQATDRAVHLQHR
jgi:hypothetical protein